MFRSKKAMRAALAGLGTAVAVISQLALATTAQAAEWDERQVRFQAANGECLTAFERSTNPVVLDRCDTDNLRGNWRMIDDGGDFLLKNWASGQCLDAQQSVLGGKVFTSECDRSDGGQVWFYDCSEGRLMSRGSTTFLTAFNSGTVGHQPRLDQDRSKQVWDIRPNPHACG